MKKNHVYIGLAVLAVGAGAFAFYKHKKNKELADKKPVTPAKTSGADGDDENVGIGNGQSGKALDVDLVKAAVGTDDEVSNGTGGSYNRPEMDLQYSAGANVYYNPYGDRKLNAAGSSSRAVSPIINKMWAPVVANGGGGGFTYGNHKAPQIFYGMSALNEGTARPAVYAGKGSAQAQLKK